MASVLRSRQLDAKNTSQVPFPPTVIEINGKRWVKAAAFVKLALAEGSIDLYQEYFVHALSNSTRFFFVQFVARVPDVPLYRTEVDRIIQSIIVTESKGAPSGTKAEL